MAEKLPSRPNRSGFLIPGNWAYHRHRARREAERVVKWPTSRPPQKEAAKPTQSVIGFMKWMRRLIDRVESQRQGRQNQRLAKVALRRTARAVAPGTSDSPTAAQQPNPARLK